MFHVKYEYKGCEKKYFIPYTCMACVLHLLFLEQLALDLDLKVSPTCRFSQWPWTSCNLVKLCCLDMLRCFSLMRRSDTM